MAGMQAGEDPDLPPSQFYEPPEDVPLRREIVAEDERGRVELHQYAFTRVRVTFVRDADGQVRESGERELAALKVNPCWFPHDLYAPASERDGGPFTIGRVIHTGRSVGFTGWIGGVAVFDRALTDDEMRRLAEVARDGPIPAERAP